ncbi:NAD(P)H-hydrate epimerase [Tautonia sociabilis]|uniref:NAD(P)H-hydrate epimerase n=1 Tax=Tautonia sociabilis TaxID=2080755 RepID=A0A432MED4_9BACT|nr:NAD(P)H-hydrate epimerase [Tautonia sociabilis]RUL83669.1 NAD(P)H-hydrate epimerase [Tautonia sociabilis]
MAPLPLRPLSRAEVRGIDARAAGELGLPTLVLMENAGRGAADRLVERAGPEPRRVLVLCGPGNNGGDGGVAARHLDARGWPVRVRWTVAADRLRGDALAQFGILERAGFDQRSVADPAELAPDLSWADWVVDGLLGTGLTREVEGPLRGVIEAVNASGRPVLALDLPSGLDCDAGRPLGAAVRAAVTVSFVSRKLGFDAPGASAFTGEVVVEGIGVPSRLLEPFREG